MKILVTGDLCPRYRGERILNGEYYKTAFAQVEPIAKSVDYRITNLECPIVNGNAKPIVKMGPNLKTTGSIADAMKFLNFDCLTLANNHIMDYGKQGLEDTLTFCKKEGFAYVGVGMNESEADKIKYIKIDGKTLAIINCCEFEFSIALGNDSGANHIDAVKQYYQIKEAKVNADYVIVIVHGGHEHWQLPSPRMTRMYRFFVDAGADSVINHHQHCYSGYEVYKGKPIFYGLGNFFFDINPPKEDELWNYGYMVVLDFSSKLSFNIYPYRQCSARADIEILQQNAFDKQLKELNVIINDEKQLIAKTNEYYENSSRDSAIVFEPIQNRYFNGLQYRSLLPLFRTKKGLRLLYNFIMCESHRDKLQYYLTKKLKNQ